MPGIGAARPRDRSFRRWFTQWPRGHERHPHTVEVVPYEDLHALRLAAEAHMAAKYGEGLRGPVFTADLALYVAAGLPEAVDRQARLAGAPGPR